MFEIQPDQTKIEKYINYFGNSTQLQHPSVYIIQTLLQFQQSANIQGDILEIGAFQGATAALLATGLGANNRICLIDPYANQEQVCHTVTEFSGISKDQIEYLKGDSILVGKRPWRFFEPLNLHLRLIHIDGEHSYNAVYSDLSLAEAYCSNQGLIILDDIFNINSACCTQAMFDYVKTHPNLHIVAIGCGKAYLCESRLVSRYRKLFIKLPEILANTNINLRISFNDWAYERSYITFTPIESGPNYQIINNRFNTLQEAIQALQINI